MQDTDFFSWRRTMLLRFQRMEAAEEVYHEIELQAQQLEYDYYSLCVRHPVPFTRPKVAFYTNYPEAWVREGANKRGNSSRLTQSFHF
ncbi:autoinducer binding domain-containing protein, partial [Escherichia coli]|uniref:autoinducer binding domain-containing protein n=1 Tax=Escherichia coli TaxID=562 RepID=UPI000AA73F2C